MHIHLHFRQNCRFVDRKLLVRQVLWLYEVISNLVEFMMPSKLQRGNVHGVLFGRILGFHSREWDDICKSGRQVLSCCVGGSIGPFCDQTLTPLFTSFNHNNYYFERNAKYNKTKNTHNSVIEISDIWNFVM